MKYLIEIHHGIGDIVQITGVIETIYNADHDSEIDLILYSGNRAELFRNDCRIKHIYFINLRDKSKIKLVKTLIILRKQKYDYALFSPISNIKGTRALAKIISARISVGEQFAKTTKTYISVDGNENDHIVIRNNNLLIQSGLSNRVSDPILCGINGNYKKPYKNLGFCIGTSKPSKTWPLKHYLNVAEQLEKLGYNVLFIGGNKEREEFPLELFEQHDGWKDYLGKTDLIGSAEILNGCIIVVGGDTGMMHIAAALNKPTITLFSCSDPSLHAPYSNNSYILTANIPCQYCYETGGYENCMHYKCLDGISEEMLFDAVTGILEGHKKIEAMKYLKQKAE